MRSSSSAAGGGWGEGVFWVNSDLIFGAGLGGGSGSLTQNTLFWVILTFSPVGQVLHHRLSFTNKRLTDSNKKTSIQLPLSIFRAEVSVSLVL